MQLAAYRGPVDGWFNNFVHLALCIGTVSAYSHCELVIDGECWSASFRNGGVRSKAIDLNTHKWDVFDIDDGDKDYALAYFKKRKGWKYSWRCIWRYPFPWLRKEFEGETICSYIIAGALRLPHPENYSPQKLVSAVF